MVTDSTAINYDSQQLVMTLVFFLLGLYGYNTCNYNVLATYDDGSCGYILGC